VSHPLELRYQPGVTPDHGEWDVCEWQDGQWKNTACTIRPRGDNFTLFSPTEIPLSTASTKDQLCKWLQENRT